MWSQPWGYREAFAIPSGLLLLGIISHFALGVIPDYAFSYPQNLIGGLLLTALSVAVALLAKRYATARFFCSYKAAIGSISLWCAEIVIMGLTRQIDPTLIQAHGLHSFVHWTGWSHILSTRYFLLLYLYALFTLGAATLHYLIYRRKERSRLQLLSFTLNHLGLYLALWGGLIGAHQIEKFQMQVNSEAEYPEWRATSSGRSELIDMDFAIGLRKFEMEEYPPKLMLIDSAGRGLPLKRPWQYSIETTPATTQYADWQFSVLEHLPFGAPVVSKDSIHFVQYGTKGAAHGVKVHARNLKTGKECEGWITAGSYLIPHRGLELDSATTLVMPQLETKQYRSEVFVIAPDGTKEEATIAVNQPLRFKGWYIYQLNYDQEKGRWSNTSVFELVRDPWLPLVYIGFAMMLLGALCLFIIPQTQKRARL